MGKWWHTLVSIGAVALAAFTPMIQNAIVGHPVLTAVLGGVWAVIGHILPSPVQGA